VAGMNRWNNPLSENLSMIALAMGTEMDKSCAACQAQVGKSAGDAGHQRLKLVFTGMDRETQYLCSDCGETIFNIPDRNPAWR
jgi:hypothetical protein